MSDGRLFQIPEYKVRCPLCGYGMPVEWLGKELYKCRSCLHHFKVQKPQEKGTMTQIGMDVVARDELVKKAVAANQAAFDAMTPEARAANVAMLAGLLDQISSMVEQTRADTINQVIKILGVLGAPPSYAAHLRNFRDMP